MVEDTQSQTMEGEIYSPPLHTSSLHITAGELSNLLEQAALKGFEMAEARRQYFQTTPDGLRDKTIHQYKPLPYTTALAQSGSLLQIDKTGEEEWKGDPPQELQTDLIQDMSDILFMVYPRPLLVLETSRAEASKRGGSPSTQNNEEARAN